jgi:hypothetical protein
MMNDVIPLAILSVRFVAETRPGVPPEYHPAFCAGEVLCNFSRAARLTLAIQAKRVRGVCVHRLSGGSWGKERCFALSWCGSQTVGALQMKISQRCEQAGWV